MSATSPPFKLTIFVFLTFRGRSSHWRFIARCHIVVTPRAMQTLNRANVTTASCWPIYSKRNRIKIQTMHRQRVRKKMAPAMKRPPAAKRPLSLKTKHRKRYVVRPPYRMWGNRPKPNEPNVNQNINWKQWKWHSVGVAIWLTSVHLFFPFFVCIFHA